MHVVVLDCGVGLQTCGCDAYLDGCLDLHWEFMECFVKHPTRDQAQTSKFNHYGLCVAWP